MEARLETLDARRSTQPVPKNVNTDASSEVEIDLINMPEFSSGELEVDLEVDEEDVLREYSSETSTTAAVASNPRSFANAVSTATSTARSAIAVQSPDLSIPLCVTADPPVSRMLRSDTSTYEIPDWRRMSAAGMTKRAITIHAQTMGMEHLQELYSNLSANVHIRDFHKHDAQYNERRAMIRQELRRLPDYQEPVTFTKHSIVAQSRIIEAIGRFCVSKCWNWCRNQVLLKALITTICTGAATTAKRRLKHSRIRRVQGSSTVDACSSRNLVPK